MLRIFFGDMPSAVYNTEIYFKNTYEDQWLLDDFAKKVIKAVDHSEVVDFSGYQKSCAGNDPTHRAVRRCENPCF